MKDTIKVKYICNSVLEIDMGNIPVLVASQLCCKQHTVYSFELNNVTISLCCLREVASSLKFPYRAFFYNTINNERLLYIHQVWYDEDGFITHISKLPEAEGFQANSYESIMELAEKQYIEDYLKDRGIIKESKVKNILIKKEITVEEFHYLNSISILSFETYKNKIK